MESLVEFYIDVAINIPLYQPRHHQSVQFFNKGGGIRPEILGFVEFLVNKAAGFL